MLIFIHLARWMFMTVMIVRNVEASPFFNQLEICANASWATNGLVFANRSVVGQEVLGIFIDKENTVYVPNQTNRRIAIWTKGSVNNIQEISGSSTEAWSIFVTDADSIFVDNGKSGRVDKWSSKSLSSISAMSVTSPCAGLFVDINYNLYCSLSNGYKVIRISLKNVTQPVETVAGTGAAGVTLDALKGPRGIFVDINFNLYVADYSNKRIHLFEEGKTMGKIVAGNGAASFSQSIGATGVVVGTDDRLYIVDNDKHQIVEASSNGIRCLVGCSGGYGTGLHELYYPYTVAFDSYGNMFVSDQNNHRILKFNIITNGCRSNLSTTTAPMVTTTTTVGRSTAVSSTSTAKIMTTIQIEKSDKITTNFISTETLSLSTKTPTKRQTTEPIYASTRLTSINNLRRCHPPIITVEFSESALDKPIEITKNQYFYISSTVAINCSDSFTSTSKWTIHLCNASCTQTIDHPQLMTNKSGELFIPARTLDYGLHEIKLTVTINSFTNLSSDAKIYLNVVRSNIFVRLIPSEASLVTHDHRQDLKLDPGSFSIDPDSDAFKTNDWFYIYYCQTSKNFKEPIGNMSHSCFSDASIVTQPSIIIPAGSLAANTVYHFMVELISRQNANFRSTGYLSVQTQDSETHMIAIGCLISTLCSPVRHMQNFAGSTQLALYSTCLNRCPSIQNVKWNIYHGVINRSNDTIQWTPFVQRNQHENIDIFGMNNSRFTATESLFERYSNVRFWKFEVTYRFSTTSSSSAIEFMIDRPSSNSSCTISPLSGTTATLFTIHCSSDLMNTTYSIYVWKTRRTERMTIGFSTTSIIHVRLPSGDEPTFLLRVIVDKRDKIGFSETISNLTVHIKPDFDRFNRTTASPNEEWRSNGHVNTIIQEITSMAQLLNKNNDENIDSVIQNGIPPVRIFVSPLKSKRIETISSSYNTSTAEIFLEKLNLQSRIRESMIEAICHLWITHINSIKLQASVMAQLTAATNQLTSKILLLASTKCYQLALATELVSNKVPFEDVKTIAADLVQCAANLRTAVNRISQRQRFVFDRDKTYANGGDEQLKFHTNQINEIYSRISAALEIHLNIGQHVKVDNPFVFFSLEKLDSSSMANRSLQLNEESLIRFPSKINHMTKEVCLKIIVERLASRSDGPDPIHNDLSRSLFFSFYDRSRDDIPIRHPMEFFISRDQNLEIPPMIRQNVTDRNKTLDSFPFKLYLVDLAKAQPNKDLTVSVHIEINPLNTSIAYLFIFKMDRAPTLNRLTEEIDGWTIFCPSHLDLTNDDLYTYYIDNERTRGHHSVIFGLRELNAREQSDFCFHRSPKTHLPLSNEFLSFSFDYRLRIYLSGCYYLDENNYWQSDGLLVGPLTNHTVTHCFSL